jgi:putative acetyltransferase
LVRFFNDFKRGHPTGNNAILLVCAWAGRRSFCSIPGAGGPPPAPGDPHMLRIIEDQLGDPRVLALLQYHASSARAQTAPGSAHALDLGALKQPDIRVWTAWDGDALAGVGALKRLSADHGEVKSMHTVQALRGRGVGSAMLRHIIAAARTGGMSRLSLETGSWDYFLPAQALYRAHGFVECAPFGDYRPDPNSVFLSLQLPG